LVAFVVGSYVTVDVSTEKQLRLDVAKVLIQTSSLETITSFIKVQVNGVLFQISVVEEPFSIPFENAPKTYAKITGDRGESSDSGEEESSNYS